MVKKLNFQEKHLSRQNLLGESTFPAFSRGQKLTTKFLNLEQKRCAIRRYNVPNLLQVLMVKNAKKISKDAIFRRNQIITFIYSFLQLI